MSDVIGSVSAIKGLVVAIDEDGVERVLALGDAIREQDLIRTGVDAEVEITLDGVDNVIALNGGQNWLATADTFTPADQFATNEAVASVDAIQAAILAGQDPTELLEPTAAGAPAAGASQGNEGADFVQLNRTAGETTPEAGYDTIGLSYTVETPEGEEGLLPEGAAAPVVSVEVSVEDPSTPTDPADPVDPADPTDPGVPSEEQPIVITASGATVLEGTSDNGGREVTFLLTLDQAYDQDVEVTYQFVPVSAGNPDDWFDGSLINTVTIPAGTLQVPVTVTIVQDHLDEGNETFNIVLLEADNATINPNASSASITILDDDTTPVANDDVNSVAEDSVLSTSGNVVSALSTGDVSDTDEDGDALLVTSVNGVAVTEGGVSITGNYGTLTINPDGSYTYVLDNAGESVQALNTGDSVVDTFSYVVTDTYNTPQTATLSIDINGLDEELPPPPPPVDLLPDAVDDEFTTSEDEPLSITPAQLLGNDEEGDGPATIVAFTQPSNGTLQQNQDGSFTYTPNGDFNGTDTFTYTIQDADGDEDTATVVITVGDVNDPPETYDSTGSGAEDAASISVTLTGDDTDGTVESFSLSNLPANGTLYTDAGLTTEAATGVDYAASGEALTLYFVPDADWNGTTTFDYAAKDDDGLVDATPATATIMVNDVNDPPETYDSTGSGAEDAASISVTLTGDDTDGTVESFSLSSLPANGTLYADAGLTTEAATGVDYAASGEALTLYFVPDADWNGTTTFDYAAKDDDGLVDATPATATITVNAENDAPELTVSNLTVSEEGLATGIADSAGNPSDSTDDSSDSATASVTDPDGGAPSYTLASPSALSSGGDVLNWDASTDTQLIGKDGDGNTIITVTIDSSTGEYNVDLSGQIDHPDGQDENLRDFTFDVKVSDGNGGEDTETVAVTIEDDSPELLAPATSGETQNTVLANVGDNDADADITATADLGIKVGADIKGATVSITDNYTDTSDDAKDATTNYVINATNNQIVTSNGASLIYLEGSDGALYAVAEGETDTANAVFSITPTINEDGSTSYTTTIYGVVDEQKITTSNTYQYNGDVVPSPGNYAGSHVLTFTDADGNNLTAEVSGYSDSDGSTDNVVTKGTVPDLPINISGERMGVDGQDIANNAKGKEDHDGELMSITFSKDIDSVALQTSQFGDGETLNWTVYDKDSPASTTASGSFDGQGNASTTTEDDTIVISSTPTIDHGDTVANDADPAVNTTGTVSTFDTVELTAGSGTSYGILLGEMEVTITEEVDVSIVLDLAAAVKDGDGDVVDTTFSVTLDGNEVLQGSDEADLIVAADGDDYTLMGLAGNDELIGADGDDTLLGGAGDDTLTGGAGADELDGGEGTDTLSYQGDTAGVVVDLDADNNGTSDDQTATGTGDANGDVVANFENVVGGSGDDTLEGDSQANELSGGAGNDILYGMEGDDELFGGTGDDTLTGGEGSDTYVYESLDEGGTGEQITDMDTDNTDGDQDSIDLSDVFNDGAELVVADESGDAVVSVDTDGTTGGTPPTEVVTVVDTSAADLENLVATDNGTGV